MNKACIVIPAIKKNAVIPDQLVKKLDGTTLIQRAIDTAMEVVEKSAIFIVTDSEEISLIAQRNGIHFHYDTTLKINSDEILLELKPLVTHLHKQYEHLILYRANAPLIDSAMIKEGYTTFLQVPDKVLVSVKCDERRVYKAQGGELVLQPLSTPNTHYYEEVKAFQVLSFENLKNERFMRMPFVLPDEKSIEIEGYQHWWVCEKILQRKRIVFNVIGSTELGMGHIYRALALAHEITNHEIIFVCDDKYKIAVDKIATADYRVISTNDLPGTILSLKPHMVINDMLNTGREYVLSLKAAGIKVINFEDLGEGAAAADLTINELYETPQIAGKNFLWGHQYLFLRDEFDAAAPHEFVENISSLLITFGGTDPNNLTLFVLKNLIETCEARNIKIYIVCGGGYLYKSELEAFLNHTHYENIELTYASGVISKIMEKTPLAISSNGRTVYELADMNIPGIVISHHEREASHAFGCLENGFLNLGVYDPSTTPALFLEAFDKLLNDTSYRKLLFLNVRKHSFRHNKQTVIQRILELL